MFSELARSIIVMFCILLSYLLIKVIPWTETPFRNVLDKLGGDAQQPKELISALLVFFAFALIYTLLNRWQSWRWLRLKRFPYAQYEDLWLQKVQIKERPYSVSRIYFDKSERRWIYEGIGFDPEFEKKAEFHTTSRHYDSNARIWLFYGDATLFQEIKVQGRVAPMLKLPNLRGDDIDGSVADLGLLEPWRPREPGRVFEIDLKRAGELCPKGFLGRRRLWTINEIRAMPQRDVKDLFSKLNMIGSICQDS
jgi:hypothetical protein